MRNGSPSLCFIWFQVSKMKLEHGISYIRIKQYKNTIHQDRDDE